MCATLMEIMKEDIDKKVQDGVQQGADQALGDATKLMNYLWENGRGNDAKKAEKDRNFLKKLLDEFKNIEIAMS